MRGRREPSRQRLVLGPALGGGVARRGLGQTVRSPALGWHPGLPSTPGHQLSVPALSSLPCGRLSRKSCLRQGSLCVAGVPSSPLPAPMRVVTTQMPPPPPAQGQSQFPWKLSALQGDKKEGGVARLGASSGSEHGKGVVCRIGLPINTQVSRTPSVSPRHTSLLPGAPTETHPKRSGCQISSPQETYPEIHTLYSSVSCQADSNPSSSVGPRRLPFLVPTPLISCLKWD